MIEQFILPAISFGLSAGALPGPLQAYVINISLLYGWRKALFVILTPLIVDIPIVIVVVFLLGQLPDVMIQAIRILGGLFLLWIARGAYQQMRSGVVIQRSDKQQSNQSGWHLVRNAVAMNFLSPGPYLFWSTINGPLLLKAIDQSPIHVVGFLLAFYGTFLGSYVIVAILIQRVGEINERATYYIFLLTIGLLLWFGVSLILEGLMIPAEFSRAVLVATALFIGVIVFVNRTPPIVKT